jgi:hypothetical protein
MKAGLSSRTKGGWDHRRPAKLDAERPQVEAGVPGVVRSVVGGPASGSDAHALSRQIHELRAAIQEHLARIAY